jgi:hypothetical protein
MFSQFDKAIVALIMAIVQLVNLFGFHFGIDQNTVTTLVALATPVLVHFVPNLPKDPGT